MCKKKKKKELNHKKVRYLKTMQNINERLFLKDKTSWNIENMSTHLWFLFITVQ